MSKHLKVSPRDGRGKGDAGRLRGQGAVPGIIYGRHRESSAIQADTKEIETTISRGERMVTVEFQGEDRLAVFRELQYHPVNQKLLHFDLYEVAPDQLVRVRLPMALVGTAKGTEEGGVVEQNIHDIEIECPAGKIPPHLSLDVSDLGIGDQLHASDIELPEGARIIEGPGTIVATCQAPRLEEEPVEAEEAAPVAESGEPEVITRRKEKEEPGAEEK